MIVHILKDGRQVNDIAGHVVKLEDAEDLYHFLADFKPKAKERTYEQRYEHEKDRI